MALLATVILTEWNRLERGSNRNANTIRGAPEVLMGNGRRSGVSANAQSNVEEEQREELASVSFLTSRTSLLGLTTKSIALEPAWMLYSIHAMPNLAESQLSSS